MAISTPRPQFSVIQVRAALHSVGLQLSMGQRPSVHFGYTQKRWDKGLSRMLRDGRLHLFSRYLYPALSFLHHAVSSRTPGQAWGAQHKSVRDLGCYSRYHSYMYLRSPSIRMPIAQLAAIVHVSVDTQNNFGCCTEWIWQATAHGRDGARAQGEREGL